LNATSALFQALDVDAAVRPPYLGDAKPSDADEIEPVKVAQSLAYITIGNPCGPLGLDGCRPCRK